ncbi:hypothetical protein ACFWGN_16205 [Oerskovia sp. NPDC060338]|uniref:hypothetical protein n=1 Tax=Oerskovia sp. NPDC060338 TaxID=3347100 RepID=UPI003665521B
MTASHDVDVSKTPGTTGYRRGCRCPECIKANATYLRDWRERKRQAALPDVQLEQAPLVVHVPDEPDDPAPEETPRASAGPIERALAADLERDDGKPDFLRAVAVTVARSLDGAVKAQRHDLVSPLAQRLVDIGGRLFAPKPDGAGELSEEEKRERVLQLIRGGAEGEEGAASGT